MDWREEKRRVGDGRSLRPVSRAAPPTRRLNDDSPVLLARQSPMCLTGDHYSDRQSGTFVLFRAYRQEKPATNREQRPPR
jgi:hypothetical protein